ncbi:Threonyl-tRNA synthetase (Threonine--tRNA ligase) (ThrRS) [Candidatus Glomeribacter gigasporarum BEG34]|uniref:Threonine--tRNA ligase n=1 Tax=Candidatus Glomeribacter gigasporarum BEG34 TaxID=1070319 RepID=G2J8C5_9BURK|nr:threonine--tRNA ligase [Candidatus Glomeribacter gigasporarum]CCD29022.1 Threonyl-tRNA synthetase (Threonine--tRNA ligase) (ThrRS) [Candidatus Glomeribacter gigasporarum BEG34]
MFAVRLLDGAVRQFDHPVSVAEAAAHISPKLAKAALAGRLDGALVDTSTLIERDAALTLITDQDKEGLEILRHSSAHLLACAVKELYPEAQVTIGPVIEEGFYYDFAYARPFTPQDLKAIEQRMRALTQADQPISRRTVSRDHAVQYFKGMGEHYKAEIVASIPDTEEIKLYSQGSFTDLCRGPHVPSTGRLKYFKLMKVAGAYWRGDARNAQLQRIYGTAWASRQELDAYLRRLEEADQRDHRKLGKQLDLFHLQDEAPGMVFWHPKGWTLWQQIERYLRARLDASGYQEIRTPQMMDRLLWERSGHWQNYREQMFATESEKRDYAIKPMSCPGHVQVFNHALRSYRDLPLRLAEFGACHRNEPSGALHGLMRVRGFVQDDAHIFCTEDQVIAETIAFNTLALQVYKDFGFTQIDIKLALRPTLRAGADAVWQRAEQGLREALTACALRWEERPGEGAFYGPKVEYHIKDALGRSWQCGTLQLDFVLPERLGAEYVAEDNSRRRPVMLHRAILGSMERFAGILLEHYAGALPAWLAPVQAVVLTVSEGQAEYARQTEQRLKKQGFRVEADLRNEKIGYKIRAHALQKIPYLLVVGAKERASQTVAARARGGLDCGVMRVDAFIEKLRDELKVLNGF